MCPGPGGVRGVNLQVFGVSQPSGAVAGCVVETRFLICAACSLLATSLVVDAGTLCVQEQVFKVGESPDRHISIRRWSRYKYK